MRLVICAGVLLWCASSPTVAQSFSIFTNASATLGPDSLGNGCLLTDVAPSCTSEAQVAYEPGIILAEAYGFAEYQELGFGSQLRSASRAWSTFGPPDVPDDILAMSSISAIITWDTDGLPGGTPIRIRFLFPYAGTLSMGIPVGGAEATVSSSLTIHDDALGIVNLFDAEATLTGTGLFQTEFEATGNWAGDFKRQSVNIPGWGDADGWALETVDEAEFDTILGEQFIVFFNLATLAFMPDENDHSAMADFSNTGVYSMEAVDPKTGEPLPVTFTPVACYADCEFSTGIFELNILDFVCFQSKFVAGDPYADCNGDGELNILDFVCFQSAFVAGCPE